MAVAAARPAQVVYAEPPVAPTVASTVYAPVAETVHSQYGYPEGLPAGGYGAYPAMTADYPQYVNEAVAQAPQASFGPVQTPFVPAPAPVVSRQPQVYASPSNQVFSPESIPAVLPEGYYVAKPYQARGGVENGMVRRRYKGESTYNQYSLHPPRIDVIRHEEMYWLE